MKRYPLLILTLFFAALVGCGKKQTAPTAVKAENAIPVTDFYEALQGAWTTTDSTKSGEKLTLTTIVMGPYIAEAVYDVDKKTFVRTFGGTWTVDKNVFKFHTEFSSDDPSAVGTSREFVFSIQGDSITFENDNKVWVRIDDGQSGNLSGAWLITGRERDGKMNRWEPGPRKTMKILSDTRFQWIAYNTETKEFFGTGGGTYTGEDKQYTENIEFFSRDGSRVGASLNFDFRIENDEWHHRGLSSKGDPIHEIWTSREDLEKE